MMDLLNDLITFVKWIKNCFALSPYVTLTMLFVFMMVIVGILRGIRLYGYDLYKKFMLLMVGSSWFTEKSGEAVKDEKSISDGLNPSEGQKVSGVDGPKGEGGSIKVEDISSLKNMISEAVKEAIKEAMKDLVVKEAKKKKEKVVSGDGTSPKKKSKKSLEVGEAVGDTVVVVSSKKKSSPKKKELVVKEEPSKEN
uniref:M-ORF n=1 Tax=Anodonta anatina TaxID=143294 RepID=A0A023I1E9_ANOAN|nr:M-ORF [Anodonta anatina]